MGFDKQNSKSKEQRIIDGCAKREPGAKMLYKPAFELCVSRGCSHRKSFLMTLGLGAVLSGGFVWVCWAAITAVKG